MAIIEFLNSAQWETKVRKAIAAVNNIRPAFVAIAKMWYKDNHEMIALKGPGQYTDFKESTKLPGRPTPYMKWKSKKLFGDTSGQRAYPILRFSGSMFNSITSPSDPEAIQIITGKSMILGTINRIAPYHQLAKPPRIYRPIIINKKVTGGFAHIFEMRVTTYSRVIDAFLRRQVKGAFGL